MSMKKRVALGALMAFVITGNAYAAELSEQDNAFYEGLKTSNFLGDFNKDGNVDENDYLLVKDKVAENLTKENLENAASDLKNFFNNLNSGNNSANGMNVTEIKNALNNLLGKVDSGDVESIKQAAENFLNKIPDEHKETVKGLLNGIISGSGDAAGGAMNNISNINDSLGKLVDFTKKMEETLVNATTKAEQLAGAVEKNLTKVDQEIKEKLEKFDAKVNAFESKLQDNLAAVDGKVKEKMEALEGKIENNLSKVDDKVKEKMEALEGKIENNLSKVDDKIKEKVEVLEDKLKDNLTSVDNKVKENMEKVEEKLKENLSAVAGAVEKNLADVDAKIKENVGKVEDKLQSNVDKVDGAVKDLAGDIKDHISESHKTHEELFDRTTDITYDESSKTTNVANNLEVGGNLVVNPNGANKVEITEDGIKVGQNSVYITGNDVTIHDATTGEEIKLSTLGNVNNLKPELNVDGTVVGALNQEAANRENADKLLQGNIDAEVANRENADKLLQGNIDAEVANRENADKLLQGNIDAEVANRENADKLLQGNIDAEVANRENADKLLQGNIDAEAEERKAADAKLESTLTSEVGRIDNKITRLEDRVDKVGAMAAAIASLKTMGYDPEAPTEIAVGVGQYRSNTGMAVGAFHYPNRDFMLNFNVSTAGEEVMGGVGATWRLGRKNANNTAEAKIAKAEALKAAAKAVRENAK